MSITEKKIRLDRVQRRHFNLCMKNSFFSEDLIAMRQLSNEMHQLRDEILMETGKRVKLWNDAY